MDIPSRKFVKMWKFLINERVPLEAKCEPFYAKRREMWTFLHLNWENIGILN